MATPHETAGQYLVEAKELRAIHDYISSSHTLKCLLAYLSQPIFIISKKEPQIDTSSLNWEDLYKPVVEEFNQGNFIECMVACHFLMFEGLTEQKMIMPWYLKAHSELQRAMEPDLKKQIAQNAKQEYQGFFRIATAVLEATANKYNSGPREVKPQKLLDSAQEIKQELCGKVDQMQSPRNSSDIVKIYQVKIADCDKLITQLKEKVNLSPSPSQSNASQDTIVSHASHSNSSSPSTTATTHSPIPGKYISPHLRATQAQAPNSTSSSKLGENNAGFIQPILPEKANKAMLELNP